MKFYNIPELSGIFIRTLSTPLEEVTLPDGCVLLVYDDILKKLKIWDGTELLPIGDYVPIETNESDAFFMYVAEMPFDNLF